jgi:hypothetical protein
VLNYVSMTPQSLRFLRTLALASTSAATACGGNVMTDGETDATSDTSSDVLVTDSSKETSTPSDTFVDGPIDAASTGTCVPRPTSSIPSTTPPLACAAGGTCAIGASSTSYDCIVADAGTGLLPCGSISCGGGCDCKSALDSTCQCGYLAGGPLAPPDLPCA